MYNETDIFYMSFAKAKASSSLWEEQVGSHGFDSPNSHLKSVFFNQDKIESFINMIL